MLEVLITRVFDFFQISQKYIKNKNYLNLDLRFKIEH